MTRKEILDAIDRELSALRNPLETPNVESLLYTILELLRASMQLEEK